MPYWHIFTLAIDRLFTNLEGEQKNIRTVTLEGAVWFVAKDVLSILGLSVRSVLQQLLKLSEDEKALKSVETLGGCQKIWTVSESGLYKLIMRSRVPVARPFQDWVTKVVLPTIRKEGVYIRGEEKIAKASNLSELEDLQEQMLNLAGRKAQILEGLLKKAEDRIAELEPQAEAYSFVFDQDGLVRLLMHLRQAGAVLSGAGRSQRLRRWCDKSPCNRLARDSKRATANPRLP